MILKLNDFEFKDYSFSERYLNNDNIEVYININYDDMSKAREFMDNISKSGNISIELLRDDKSSVVKYDTSFNEVYKEIDVTDDKFIVILSYITSKN